MTLRAHLSRIFSWWKTTHPDRALETIPDYAEAARRERRARQRGDTRAIGRARKAKYGALHAALAGKRRAG